MPSARSPITPPDAADFYLEMAAREKRVFADIGAYGWKPYRRMVHKAFEEFYLETDIANAQACLDPIDLLYWEHHIAASNALECQIMDFAADTFDPLNARSILVCLLAVDKKQRSAVLRRIAGGHCFSADQTETKHIAERTTAS
jgi:hypothetical protein